VRIISNETMAGYVFASSTQLSGQGGRSTRKQGLFPPRHGCNKSFKQQVFVALEGKEGSAEGPFGGDGKKNSKTKVAIRFRMVVIVL